MGRYVRYCGSGRHGLQHRRELIGIIGGGTRYFGGVSVVFLVLIWFLSGPVLAELAAVEDFASLPDVRQAELAPDGLKLASVVRVDGVKTGELVQVLDLEAFEHRNLLFAENIKFTINWILWANKRHLLVSTAFPETRFGVESTETRLLILDTESGEVRNAVPERRLKQFKHPPQFQDQIVDLLIDDEKHFLLALDGESPTNPGVYRIRLDKPGLEPVEPYKMHVKQWIVDRQHRVRIGIQRDGSEYRIRHRPLGGKDWATLWTFQAFSAEAVWPVGFDADPNQLYVTALNDDRLALFRVDLGSSNLSRELVYANADFDADVTLVWSDKARSVVGITTPDQTGYQFWDEKYRALDAALARVLPDRANAFVGISSDENRYLVYSSSSTHPGSWYVGNFAEKQLMEVALRYGRLDPVTMAPKHWLSYTARDGLEIPAALTLPPGASADAPSPAVIFPHGGPIAFDDDGFDIWTQFFVSRGFAVLQMNFRGSSGYGYQFQQAGLKGWGLEMQNDVEDGARWMIAQGLADPERICIVGASYGGYAALMGAALAPDLYRCAVSVNGVTDIPLMLQREKQYTGFEIVRRQIGDSYGELRKRSPVSMTDRITAPVLLIHAADDRVVDVEQSRRMHKRLKGDEARVEYIELEHGGHSLENNAERIRAFQAMDRFLRAHLTGGDAR